MRNSTPTNKTAAKKALPKHITNVLKKDNQQRKVKKVVHAFAQAECAADDVSSGSVARVQNRSLRKNR